MKLNDFKARLKGGNLVGCYVFAGEEDYLKRYYLGELRRAVVADDTLSAFNYAVYEGAEVDFGALRDEIMAPPMMSEQRLIEWRYPNFDKMKDKELDALEATLELLREQGTAVLAFLVNDADLELGTEKRPSKLVKRFGESMNILVFEKSTDAQLLSWLKKHFDAESISVSADTLRALLFRSGHSMSVLASEVDKLCAYAKARGRTEIDVRDVNEVASSTPEADTFALSNAILDRNKRDAFLALEEMKQRRLDPIMIFGMIAKTYSELASIAAMLADGMRTDAVQSATKMHEYKLRRYAAATKKFTTAKLTAILAELTRVDAGAKYGGVAGYTAIELFVSKCV